MAGVTVAEALTRLADLISEAADHTVVTSLDAASAVSGLCRRGRPAGAPFGQTRLRGRSKHLLRELEHRELPKR